MDMIDSVLPVYIDYLGQFEQDRNGVSTPHDVLIELMNKGVQKKKFLHNAELNVSGGKRSLAACQA